MKIGMSIEYARDPLAQLAKVPELERAGVDMVWVAEAYGLDAVSVMGYLASITDRVEIASGILPVYTRTPSLLAQTAVGLDTLSDGRFILGLGASGPQVIEGWHGMKYTKPIQTTREVIEICRKVWRREEPVTHDGDVFTLPLPPDQGTGLGKPLKIINHPKRHDIPILLASLGPKNVEMTAELANEWLPVFFVPERAMDVWGDDIARGMREARPRPRRDGHRRRRRRGLRVRGRGRSLPRLWAGRWLRSTSAAWERRAATSTTTSCPPVRLGRGSRQLIQNLYLDGRKEEADGGHPRRAPRGDEPHR